jgi:hypothetical protein
MLQSCCKTSIVYEDVDTSERLKMLYALRLRANIKVENNTLRTLSLYLTLECFETLLATTSDDDFSIRLRETQSCSTSDA